MSRELYAWQEEVIDLVRSIRGPFHMTLRVPRQRGASTLASGLQARCGFIYLHRRSGGGSAHLLATETLKRDRLGFCETNDKKFNGCVVDNVMGDECQDLREAFKDRQLIEITSSDDVHEVQLTLTFP